MPNPFISFRCPKELADKIRARAQQLGFDDPGDYLRQLARREIAEADGKSFSIVAERSIHYEAGKKTK
jgi:hypothetical protein